MTAPRAHVRLLFVAQIRPSPANIRDHLPGIPELAASIREVGLLQPLVVTPIGTDQYQIVDGHRRHAALKAARVQETLAVVWPQVTTPTRATVLMLAAAMHASLTPVEQGRAFKQLRDTGLTVDQIAKATGYTPALIRSRLDLLGLPAQAVALVEAKALTLAQAGDLARQHKTTRAGHVTTTTRRGHFTPAHPQADAARAACTPQHRATRTIHGCTACGPCWEAAIRADATTATGGHQ